MPLQRFGGRLACSLREMKRTRDVWNVLLAVVDNFSDEYRIQYRLTGYARQSGNLKAGRRRLEKARELAGEAQVKCAALDDPDMEPLWPEIL
jgi:hypothetical protein